MPYLSRCEKVPNVKTMQNIIAESTPTTRNVFTSGNIAHARHKTAGTAEIRTLNTLLAPLPRSIASNTPSPIIARAIVETIATTSTTLTRCGLGESLCGDAYGLRSGIPVINSNLLP